ncbi:MAG: hypothetical protein IAE89_02785 [Anaerolineae bacterium]|nr:hypothetical protein [Anaerolineae bacterium]
MSEIAVRILENIEDYETAVDIEIAVWGVGDRDVLPSSLMQAIRAAGGVSLGAFAGERMVGMSVAFPGFRDGAPILWSHVTGVLVDYQRQNIGYKLKQAQAEWGRAAGYREIHWTFDPLQAGNAHFNLNMLGVTSNRYYVNFYGTMNDSINKGMGSDRLEASWDLTILHQPPTDHDYTKPLPQLVSMTGNKPSSNLNVLGEELILVEIPCGLRSIDTSTRKTWRLCVREALLQAFEAGYTAVDFQRSVDQCAYILSRSTL